MKTVKYILSVAILFFSKWTHAQDIDSALSEKSFFEQYQVEIILGLAVLVCLVALLAMYVLLVAMRTMLRMHVKEDKITETVTIKAKKDEENISFWNRFWNRFHQAVPVTKEQTVATDHVYDGIKELDNRLPSWWLYGFYVTIIFSAVYMLNYHVFGTGANQHEEFETDLQKAKEEVQSYLASLDNIMDENTVTLATEAADIAEGEAIYQASCAVCHANDGGGGVGPNFTDNYWLHGGDIKSIFKVIKYGVPEKGMISWEAQLSPKKIQQVASYIYAMEGTIPENPKEPQGELFERPIEMDSTATEADQASL